MELQLSMVLLHKKTPNLPKQNKKTNWKTHQTTYHLPKMSLLLTAVNKIRECVTASWTEHSVMK